MKQVSMKVGLLSFTLSSVCFLNSVNALSQPLAAKGRQEKEKQVVLIIGDSHLGGPFGDRLYELMRKNPKNEVYLYSSCGTTVKQWYTGQKTHCDYVYKGPHYRPPYLDEKNGEWVFSCKTRDCIETQTHATPLVKVLLASVKPNLVVVEQGTNYADEKIAEIEKDEGYTPLEKQLALQKRWDEIRDHEAAVEKEMRNLALDIHLANAKCAWVGLPDTLAFRSQQEYLVDVTKKANEWQGKTLCQFIDSTELTQYPDFENDRDPSGVHYFGKRGTEEARSWAEKVFEKLSW